MSPAVLEAPAVALPVPSLLGGNVPHPGLAPTSRATMLVNGVQGWSANLGDALQDIQISFKIDGTAVVNCFVDDNHRTLLRSPLTQQRSVLTIDGVNFVLQDVRKTGPQLQLAFEHVISSKLKQHTDVQVVQAGVMSRTAFVRQLCRAESFIEVLTPAGDSPGLSQVILANGDVDPTTGQPSPPTISTVTALPESYWDSSGRILDEIGWRRFIVGATQLLLVPDTWLYSQAPIYTPTENSSGVDTIDFDWDVRKPLGELQITCRAEAWAWPVGSVILLGADMGIAAGKWLVTDIERSLFSALATITLDQPQPTIPEPSNQNTSSSPTASTTGTVQGSGSAATVVPASYTPGKASSTVQSFVNFALSKKGGPYVWGGTGPNGYDCSGLVQAAAKHVGVNDYPRVTTDQYRFCQDKGTAIDVASAVKTYGAIVFRRAGTDGPDDSGHTAISLGNGSTIEAMGTAYGIVNGACSTSRFNEAALLPEIDYSA